MALTLDKVSQGWRAHLPSCLWTIGFTIFLVGNVLDFLALGWTKVSIVTLVGSGSLVVNTVMARVLLKETVTRLDVAAAFLIIIGISMTVIGNNSPVKDWTIDKLITQYQRTDVVAMLLIFAAVIISCFVVMGLDTMRRRAVVTSTGGPLPKMPRAIAAITCVVGAFVATFTILFGKAFSGLIYTET
jgi:drug/metabolite transporter (DMT)-like permease